MSENWKPILGLESRYEVSDLGRVKSLSFMQRYLLRNGREAFRRTRERIVAQQTINSGYTIVHLHFDGNRYAKLVHRLVAVNFVDGFDIGREVNHKDGNKANNAASNLEWTTRSGNLRHAVTAGLNTQALPAAGFPSTTQAAKALNKSHRTVRKMRGAS
jgi:NUMOD4 motif/HNH endonuclease